MIRKCFGRVRLHEPIGKDKTIAVEPLGILGVGVDESAIRTFETLLCLVGFQGSPREENVSDRSHAQGGTYITKGFK